MKKTLLLFVAALVAAFTLSAFPLLGGNSPAVGLEGRSDFFFNADSRLGIDEVSDAGHASRFTPVGSRTILVGRQAPAGWLRFTVPASDLGPGYGDAKAGETRAPVASCRARAFPSSSIMSISISGMTGPSNEVVKRGAKASRRPGDAYSRFFIFELPRSVNEGNPAIRLLSRRARYPMCHSTSTSRRASTSPGGSGFDYIAYGLLYGHSSGHGALQLFPLPFAER